MSFQFVENAKIDGPARKLIRSHVMKGKNTGKVRARPVRKPEQARPDENLAVEFRSSALLKDSEINQDKVIQIPPAIGDGFSYFSFSNQVQPYMRELISQFQFITSHKVYPAEFCLPVNASHQIWFQYMLSDEAFFHSAIAMFEVARDSRMGNHETAPRALYHLSNVYRCISQNIQRDAIPSDTTIAAVVSMAYHEDLKGQPERGKIHIYALQRMVELRGGVESLETNLTLVHKMCRADIEYAIHDGSQPRLKRDQFPREMIQSMLHQSCHQSEIPSELQISDPNLRDLILDLSNVCNLLNNDRLCFKLEPYAYQEILVSLCYRLLHQCPLAGNVGLNDHENAYQLGLLALMTTMLNRTDSFQRISYDLLAGRLREAVEKMLNNDAIGESGFLWLLLVSGISVLTALGKAWLFSLIRTCSLTLNLESWQVVRDKIRTYPWIDVLHDDLGRELWQAATCEEYDILSAY